MIPVTREFEFVRVRMRMRMRVRMRVRVRVRASDEQLVRISCHDSAVRQWLVHLVGNLSELRQLLVFPRKA